MKIQQISISPRGRLFIRNALCVAFMLLANPWVCGEIFVKRLEAGVSLDLVDSDRKLGNTNQSYVGGEIPPFVASAGVEVGPNTAFALQTQNGFFQSLVVAKPSGLGGVTAHANTDFFLQVETDMPDTRLLVDFHFLGAKAEGKGYYGQGEIMASYNQTISVQLDGGLEVEHWKLWDAMRLTPSGTQWQSSVSDFDLQGIGLPVSKFETGYDGFQATGKLTREAFAGTLDFGLLQPGHRFTLHYTSNTIIEGHFNQNFDSKNFVSSELVDPFTLSGNPPMQVSVRGLDLSHVPEPGVALLLVPALAALSLKRRRCSPVDWADESLAKSVTPFAC